jgi:hypothetical protein
VLTVHLKIVGGCQQLETHVDWDLHVRDVFLVLVSVPVKQVLHYLFQDNGTMQSRSAMSISRTRGQFCGVMQIRGEKQHLRSSVVDSQPEPFVGGSVRKNTAK